jgi:ABC-type lipoprotein release transport system permease subunit
MVIARMAWRSLWRNKRRTTITVSSIAMGLAIAVFFLAMGEGVYHQIVNDGVRMQAGHITLQHPEYQAAPAVDLFVDGPPDLRRQIEGLPGVERTKLLVVGQGVAKSASGAVGVTVMGIEPDVERVTSPLAHRIVSGTYLEAQDDREIALGEELASRLHVDVGKKVVLTTNNAAGDLVEELCRVKGIFRTGSPELDTYLVQATLPFTRRLYTLGPDAVTQLGIILDQPDRQQPMLRKLRTTVDECNMSVLPWQDILPELAAYIRMDRASNWVFQGLLTVIILFTILNTLLMSIIERDREFAVLLALGTPVAQLEVQIAVESLLLGCIGCAAGLMVGGFASWAMQVWGLDFGFLMPEGVTVSGLAISTRIYSRLSLDIFLWTGGVVLGATLLLSLFPMRRVGRVPIAETLRT